jgi:hypothetical protein
MCRKQNPACSGLPQIRANGTVEDLDFLGYIQVIAFVSDYIDDRAANSHTSAARHTRQFWLAARQPASDRRVAHQALCNVERLAEMSKPRNGNPALICPRCRSAPFEIVPTIPQL